MVKSAMSGLFNLAKTSSRSFLLSLCFSLVNSVPLTMRVRSDGGHGALNRHVTPFFYDTWLYDVSEQFLQPDAIQGIYLGLEEHM